MKNIIKITVVLFSILFFACNSAEIERLEHQKDSLETENLLRERTMNDFANALFRIQTNVKEIKEKTGLIDVNTFDENNVPIDTIAKINNDIIEIFKQLYVNQTELTLLQEKMSKSKVEMSGFKQLIAELEASLAERESEISALKQELAKKNVDITNLNNEIEKLNKTISGLEHRVDTLSEAYQTTSNVLEKTTNTLHTAWYIIGTKKDLLKSGIIEKAGGIIGIGSAFRLKKNVKKSSFKEIDIRNTPFIKIGSKKVELVTVHPEGSFSYKMEGKIFNELEIVDYEQFWHNSKYLVVIIK